MVASKETWARPVNHLYEDMPGTEEDIGPTVSPLDAWLGDGQFSDCFAETVSREKLENAEIIGVSRRHGVPVYNTYGINIFCHSSIFLQTGAPLAENFYQNLSSMLLHDVLYSVHIYNI